MIKLVKKKIIWEHGRRNFALRIDVVLPIVCPFTDEGKVSCACGMGIFNASIDKVITTHLDMFY
jgi:hypothetical protein